MAGFYLFIYLFSLPHLLRLLHHIFKMFLNIFNGLYVCLFNGVHLFSIFFSNMMTFHISFPHYIPPVDRLPAAAKCSDLPSPLSVAAVSL